ncbi:MAG: hypothetical protein FJZ63_00085 [Chlamydiae bacterium]|nr:hypothetical protein [Chlamydiota bacterium]
MSCNTIASTELLKAYGERQPFAKPYLTVVGEESPLLIIREGAALSEKELSSISLSPDHSISILVESKYQNLIEKTLPSILGDKEVKSTLQKLTTRDALLETAKTLKRLDNYQGPKGEDSLVYFKITPKGLDLGNAGSLTEGIDPQNKPLFYLPISQEEGFLVAFQNSDEILNQLPLLLKHPQGKEILGALRVQKEDIIDHPAVVNLVDQHSFIKALQDYEKDTSFTAPYITLSPEGAIEIEEGAYDKRIKIARLSLGSGEEILIDSRFKQALKIAIETLQQDPEHQPLLANLAMANEKECVLFRSRVNLEKINTSSMQTPYITLSSNLLSIEDAYKKKLCDTVIYLPISSERGIYLAQEHAEKILQLLPQLLQSPSMKKVFENISFTQAFAAFASSTIPSKNCIISYDPAIGLTLTTRVTSKEFVECFPKGPGFLIDRQYAQEILPRLQLALNDPETNALLGSLAIKKPLLTHKIDLNKSFFR